MWCARTCGCNICLVEVNISVWSNERLLLFRHGSRSVSLALDAVTAVSRSYKRNKEIGLIFLFTYWSPCDTVRMQLDQNRSFGIQRRENVGFRLAKWSDICSATCVRSVHASSIITFRPFVILWRGTEEQQSRFVGRHIAAVDITTSAVTYHTKSHTSGPTSNKMPCQTQKAVKKIKVHLKQFINL